MCKVGAQPCRFMLEMFSKDFTQLHTFRLKTLISETTWCSFYLEKHADSQISACHCCKTLKTISNKKRRSKDISSPELCNKPIVKPPFPPSSCTHLYCCILRGRHHDTEDWVEDDAGDWTAVATQRVPFWWAWDPLFGITLLSYGPTKGDLFLRFIQFGF